MTIMLEMVRIRDAIFFFPLHAAAAISKWWKKCELDYREQVVEEKRRESLEPVSNLMRNEPSA